MITHGQPAGWSIYTDNNLALHCTANTMIIGNYRSVFNQRSADVTLWSTTDFLDTFGNYRQGSVQLSQGLEEGILLRI